jgi:P4 family phage/plasmid primase-like protien
MSDEEGSRNISNPSTGDVLTDFETEHSVLGLNAGRYSNIPRSLQGAGFLQWDCRADRPKQPHFDGDFSISWSDPDEWNDFETVAEIADKNDTYGIGYVNGAGNDDFEAGHRATIDIDGAIDEDGELRDWVPSLEPFFDRGAYIEYSVSYAEVLLGEETDGAGLHIPIKRADMPGWWSDSEFEDRHEGVDLLENKFCTVTGLKHPESGDQVVKYGKWIDEWLAEAYRNIRNEEPSRGDDDSEESAEGSQDSENHVTTDDDTENSGDNDAARKDVEAALQHVGYAQPDGDEADNTLHYNKWIKVAYAVHSWNEDDEITREVFDNWTKDSPKYEEPESREAVDWVWENADAGDSENDNQTTLGTLFHMAMENGWEGPSNTEYTADPAEAWGSWATRRKDGDLGPESKVPVPALEHIAREHGFYNFDALPSSADELPPKAYNKALWWVKNEYGDEEDFFDEDATITARDYKPRTATVLTWEDVRYIYGDSKEHGRKAARGLLSDRHHFMTLADGDTLQIYDPETGVFTDRTGDIRGKIYHELGEHWSTHELNEILAGLRQQSVVQPRHVDAGDRDEPLICVDNGVLDVFERELHDHSPEYHFVNRVPVEYDPNAETDTYDEFVGDLVDREDRKQTLFEMVGHALLPDANSRYKKFLILTGDADNGKSMFYDCVSTLLNGPDGEENNTAAVKLAKLAQNRFSLNSMYGSLANIAGEIDGKKIRNTANLKDITGGDEVEIEPKGSDSFFDTIGTTLMFAANDPPILGERDKKAIASRIVPVELPYTFVDNPSGEYEKERVAEDTLRSELEADESLSGFLNLALDGLERLEANHGEVSLKESPQKRLELYERSADPMREFGTVALQNDPDDYVVKADIVTLYKEFATQQGYEVGSSVEKVLHHALRGLPDLNYTDSRPQDPNYNDTSLPLQGWDSRKRVINRVTLTEEGMELAESAGLVEEPDDALVPPAPEDAPPKTVDDISPNEMVDGAVLPPVRATVAGVWENSYDTMVGELHSGDTRIDVEFAGVSILETPVDEGAVYVFDGLRARNERGQRGYVEHRPTTETELIEPADDQADTKADADTTEQTATDGGDTPEDDDTGDDDTGDDDTGDDDTGDTDDEGDTPLRPSLIENGVKNINTQYDSGDEITAPSFAGRNGLSPKQGQAVLKHLATEKGLLERLEDGYKVL